TVLGPLSQNGIDMAPTPAMIHTWEAGCREYTGTLAAWRSALSTDFAAFNALLAKNNLATLKSASTGLTAPATCKFARSPGGRKG
ncbi:MAG: hypothetical protein JO053_11315, partial [Acidobacteria bacterium]|nr:hypothetical protein [Acidobacteriota bacterium]